VEGGRRTEDDSYVKGRREMSGATLRPCGVSTEMVRPTDSL